MPDMTPEMEDEWHQRRLEKTIERFDKAFELEAQFNSHLIPLRREGYDNSIFGWRCGGCDQSWKVYQSEYHASDCEYNPDNLSQPEE